MRPKFQARNTTAFVVFLLNARESFQLLSDCQPQTGGQWTMLRSCMSDANEITAVHSSMTELEMGR